jgi:hypothetical protein
VALAGSRGDGALAYAWASVVMACGESRGWRWRDLGATVPLLTRGLLLARAV